MLDSHFKKEEFKKAVKENVKMLYRKTIDEATQQQIFQAVSLAVKDVIIDNWLATQKQYEKDDPKIVYYLSMEFLMGRALGNNLINLTAYKEVKEALIRGLAFGWAVSVIIYALSTAYYGFKEKWGLENDKE